MRRYVFGLLLPLLAACAGKNTVAGEEKTKAEQLQESVPDWCAKACQKVEACAKERPCDCGGDPCDCSAGPGYDCDSSCKQLMDEFVGKGETCAGAGLHFQSCIDAASCSDLQKDSICLPADPAEKGCYPEDSATPSDSGSSSAYAGSANIGPGPSSGGAYGAGGASGGFAYGGTSASGGSTGEGGSPASDIVSCDSGFSSGPAPGNTTNEICEGGGLGCSDGHEYRYLCAHTSDGRSACSCFVDDNVTGAFDPNGVCPTSAALNAGCGWSLTGF